MTSSTIEELPVESECTPYNRTLPKGGFLG